MVIRVTWGKLRAGAWSDFERTYRANVITKGKAVKGLRGRWLAQDSGDKDTGFAVSLWDNLPDMQAYEQSALYKERMRPPHPCFVGEYKTYPGQVKSRTTPAEPSRTSSRPGSPACRPPGGIPTRRP